MHKQSYLSVDGRWLLSTRLTTPSHSFVAQSFALCLLFRVEKIFKKVNYCSNIY
jgi:hypothetical protein